MEYSIPNLRRTIRFVNAYKFLARLDLVRTGMLEILSWFHLLIWTCVDVLEWMDVCMNIGDYFFFCCGMGLGGGGARVGDCSPWSPLSVFYGARSLRGLRRVSSLRAPSPPAPPSSCVRCCLNCFSSFIFAYLFLCIISLHSKP